MSWLARKPRAVPFGKPWWLGASAYFTHMTTPDEYGVYAEMGLVELKAFTHHFGTRVHLTSVTPGVGQLGGGVNFCPLQGGYVAVVSSPE